MPGGTFFFTVVTHQRRPLLTSAAARDVLRIAMQQVKTTRPFRIEASVLMPDHLHCIWTLPADDTDFSTRWRLIKAKFTILFLDHGGRESRRSQSRQTKRERGFWQRRFWEHTVRHERELYALFDYIHYNPVKHGHVECPHAWPYSSFHRSVADGFSQSDWQCTCSKPRLQRPSFTDLEDFTGE